MAYNLSGEEQRLQRKLIPLNIVVCIISLIAALSLIFAPIVTVDIGKLIEFVASDSDGSDSGSKSGVRNSGAGGYTIDRQGSALASYGSEDGSEGDGNGDVQNPDGGSGESSGKSDGLDLMGMLKSMDMKLSISAYGAAKVAFAPEDKKAEALIGDVLLDTGLIDNLMKNLANTVLVGMIEELDEEQQAAVTDLVETLDKFDNVKNKEEFTVVINEYIDKLSLKIDGGIPADERAEFLEMSGEFYDKTMENLDGNSKFSLEAMVCVLVSTAMSEGKGEGEDAAAQQKIATSYEELLSNAMSGDGSMGDVGESFAEMKEQMNAIAGYYGYIFYAMLVFAAIWLILFISAFRRIFSRNKRFTMWAVKLFGFLPCLIFGVAPLVLKSLAGTLFGDDGQMIISVLEAVTTMTWISGACYILLWLISIFWAFPIKRKIRQLRKS